MIEHVYRRVAMCSLIDDVYIATCDEEIAQAARAFGAQAIMTASTHERASDRVAEAARHLPHDIVVLVQGDEPMVTPAMVEASLRPFEGDEAVGCVNLARRIDGDEELRDPNTIKVAMDLNGDALYFSREPIPVHRPGAPRPVAFKQVCVIPFRRDVLLRYADLSPTPLEIAESVDMLRLLEHGMKVRMVEIDEATHAVDTPGDLLLVQQAMLHDPLRSQYDPSPGPTA